MANTQTLTVLLVFYFICITVAIGALSPILADSGVVISGNPAIAQPPSTELNTTVNLNSAWNIGDALENVIGFYTFDMVLGIGQFEWIIKLFFVWFPLLILVLMGYYSVRGI